MREWGDPDSYLTSGSPFPADDLCHFTRSNPNPSVAQLHKSSLTANFPVDEATGFGTLRPSLGKEMRKKRGMSVRSS